MTRDEWEHTGAHWFRLVYTCRRLPSSTAVSNSLSITSAKNSSTSSSRSSAVGGGREGGVVTPHPWGWGHPGCGHLGAGPPRVGGGARLTILGEKLLQSSRQPRRFFGALGAPKTVGHRQLGGGGQGGRLGTRPSPTPGHFGGSSPLPPSFWHHWGGPRSGSSAPSPKQWPLPSSSITEGVPKVAPLPPPGSLGRPPVLPSPTWSAAQPPSTARTPWANKPPSSNPGAAITTSTQTPPTERRAHRAATPAERRARDGEKGKEGRGVEEAWPREGRGGAKGGRPERTTVPGGPRAAAVT